MLPPPFVFVNETARDRSPVDRALHGEAIARGVLHQIAAEVAHPDELHAMVVGLRDDPVALRAAMRLVQKRLEGQR